MAESIKAKIPRTLFNKGEELSKLTGLPRTQSFGIFCEGITTPTRTITKRIPKSKDWELTLIWEKKVRIRR